MKNKNIELLGDMLINLGYIFYSDESLDLDELAKGFRRIARRADRYAGMLEQNRGVSESQSLTPIGAASDTCPVCKDSGEADFGDHKEPCELCVSIGQI